MQVRFRNYDTVSFRVKHQRQTIYQGIVTRRANTISGTQNTTANTNQTSISKKRDLNILETNITSTAFNLPASNAEYTITIQHLGRNVARSKIFSTVLSFLLYLSQLDAVAQYSSLTFDVPGSGANIYIIEDPAREQVLQVFLAVNLLEAIARNAVHTNIFQESMFKLLANGQVIASGCLTAPTRGLAWCLGML
ncbi:hypothetical protein MMC28_006488 [Mycoblastus sanguinarius]|nr:hypothetical protein [Mycoblastus sanguinarius]